MAGSPRGWQFTDDFDSSSSVGVIALILASAHDWNDGFSSGVTFGSNVERAAGSTPKRPLTPCPAPFGNQCPDKTGCPSGNRGAWPPGGRTLMVYSAVCPPACAKSAIHSVKPVAQTAT